MQRWVAPSQPIKLWQAPELPAAHYEQSSENIWSAVCLAVRECVALARASHAGAPVVALGFCATCSLVALDAALEPVSVSLAEGRAEQNVVLWADHRAAGQAERISASGHAALRLVGGRVSAEMQLPKVLWLREHLPAARFDRVAHWLDLCDFLTLRATGSAVRSVCPLVCKWLWDEQRSGGSAGSSSSGGWDAPWLAALGLGQLEARMGGPGRAADPGACAGRVTSAAARELGLEPGCAVSAGLIDAHCGALGLLDVARPGASLAIVAGTSNCILGLCAGGAPRLVEGLWAGALARGLWCNEGGQSTAGSLLDHVARWHPARAEVPPGVDLFAWAEQRLAAMARARGLASPATLTRDLHLTADFNGNRSPFSRADMSGVLSGLTLAPPSADDLCLCLLAAAQALAYSTRLIIDRMRAAGYAPERLELCGGVAHGSLLVTALADATGLPVRHRPEAVLLGGAVLALAARIDEQAQASEAHALSPPREPLACLARARQLVTSPDDTLTTTLPNTQLSAYHDAKLRIFAELTLANLRHCDLIKGVLGVEERAVHGQGTT